MKEELFYASGLRFSCKRCSACCRYDPGFVYLSEEDLKKLTFALKLDKNRVLSQFCRWVTDWNGDLSLSLKEKSNKDCIFWDNGCTVYEARPVQCITFPFWQQLVTSSAAWETAGSGCPGINSGLIHTKEKIGQYLELRNSEPILKKQGGEL